MREKRIPAKSKPVKLNDSDTPRWPDTGMTRKLSSYDIVALLKLEELTSRYGFNAWGMSAVIDGETGILGFECGPGTPEEVAGFPAVKAALNLDESNTCPYIDMELMRALDDALAKAPRARVR